MIVAVIDACVLYSAALRDLIMHLTATFVLQPKWTDRIHAEWIDNLLEHRPDLDRSALERTRDLMNRWARDWHVPKHEALITTLTLPDPADRHVLAAAIASGAPFIVTFNLSDFPPDALAPHGIRAMHPDTLACELLEETPEAFLKAAQAHRAALTAPPRSVDEYISTLAACGLTQLAMRLSDHRNVL